MVKRLDFSCLVSTEFESSILTYIESLRTNYRIKIRIYRQDNKSRSEDRRDLHNWREIVFFFLNLLVIVGICWT